MLNFTNIDNISTLFKSKRKFRYMQLGISSNCILSCKMCPRTDFQDSWNSTDMSIETFRNTSKFFPHTERVYLSGWGEPLLNPNFPSMIHIAKQAGCFVGFTTNGALLDDTITRKIISLQTDLVSMSFAGATPETHEFMRTGSDFEQLTRNLRRVADLKITMNSESPHILMLFMMTKKNVNELPKSVQLAADLGADSIVAANLDYTPMPFHDDLKAFSCEKADPTFVREVREAHELADAKNLPFHVFSLEREPTLVCSEDPLHNLYISEEGFVSPCVYLALPMREIPRIFCGEKVTIPRTSFGNINDRNLFEIWADPGYSLFRKKFEERLKTRECASKDSLPEACRTCYKCQGI